MSDTDVKMPVSWLSIQIGYALSGEHFRRAIADIWDGWKRRALWMTIGLHDIRQRYRRSVLGPFWITLSTGIMIGALGLLYSQIFKVELADYLPFLAAGLFVWGVISNLVIEGCQAFTSSEHLIKQLSAPLSIYVYRVLWSNLLTALHNVWIFVLIAVWLQMPVGWPVLLVVPALLVVMLNGLWVGLLLGLLSARFRDVPMIVGSVVQVMFFLTPVIWKPNMLPGRTLLLDANPFYHFVQILRGPMLGEVPGLEHWVVALIVTVLGWVVALGFYTAYRWRLAYWV
jgi:ABC-2 type transport system permease protein/lipopolysaccharide transport system permease protein